MSRFVDDNQQIEKELREAAINIIFDFSDHTKVKNDVVEQKHTSLLETLKNMGFDTLQNILDVSLNNQARFYCIYTKLFESILLFIRATREQSWELHLYSLHKLSPYFFAFDMTNYARMTPVYLSQMFYLKESHQRTRDTMFSGCFCVSKSEVPFTSIGADHGIEQENRALKVLGGIKGIANSSECLEEYFLSAAEMSNIIADFCVKFGIAEDEARKRKCAKKLEKKGMNAS